MANFYITRDEDTIAYYSPIVKYRGYEILPQTTWGDEVINPPTPIGRDPQFFCKSVRVYKGRLPTSPTMYVVDIEFDEPKGLTELQKEWKSNPPKFETFKNVKVIHKKKLGDNLYAG